MITAHGQLVRIDTNEKGYRTAIVYAGGDQVERFDVAQSINGELDERLGQAVALELRTRTRWFDGAGGKRFPSTSLRITRVLGDAA